MAHYQCRGSVPPKRHTQHRDSDGALLYEELIGERGFSSDSSLLYHRNIPSAIVDTRPWLMHDQQTIDNCPLLPRHFKLHELFAGSEAKATDAVVGRRLILANDDVRISYVVAGAASPLYRNAIGDECVYLEAGSAVVETLFGSLRASAGDYVLLPRATTHRWLPLGDEPLRAYCMEASGHIKPPSRYLSHSGQLLEHAPYCERDLHPPGDPPQSDDFDVEIYLKHRGGRSSVVGTVHVAQRHPFDVVGWDGCFYPYTFNIHDFEPITGRVHQPPPVHQVFEGPNFVICNFVPRKVDYHPLSIPVPYYHSNVDSDEVMFYVGGDYEARRGSGIEQGSLSLHPSGHTHGPQPGSYEHSIGVEFFDELTVMVDTFRSLSIGEGGRAVEDDSYAWSWSDAAPRREHG
jgi:homogentisate 1,2-dioxygenase